MYTSAANVALLQQMMQTLQLQEIMQEVYSCQKSLQEILAAAAKFAAHFSPLRNPITVELYLYSDGEKVAPEVTDTVADKYCLIS